VEQTPNRIRPSSPFPAKLSLWAAIVPPWCRCCLALSVYAALESAAARQGAAVPYWAAVSSRRRQMVKVAGLDGAVPGHFSLDTLMLASHQLVQPKIAYNGETLFRSAPVVHLVEINEQVSNGAVLSTCTRARMPGWESARGMVVMFCELYLHAHLATSGMSAAGDALPSAST